MDNSVIARSGWLMRRVSGKDWRKNWIELYRDGYLKYYENDYSPNPEDVINMPTECISIKTGLQVEESYCPPNGFSSQCVFAVSASGNKKWVFCADSPDDMRAWQLALEQARLLISRPPHHPQHGHPHPHHQTHHQTHPHAHHPFNINHSSILHSMRLAGLPGSSTLPLDEYHRLNQYTQLQHMINSRTLPLPFNHSDPRISTYPLHLPAPNVSQSNNSTTTSTPSSAPVTTTAIFPIPVSPVSAPPPRLPCFNFNYPPPSDQPLRHGPFYPPISQSTSLPSTPLSSQSRMFPLPFTEPDARALHLDLLAGSTTSTDARLGTNRLVWPPFIWW